MANVVEIEVRGTDEISKVLQRVSKTAEKAFRDVEAAIESIPDLDIDVATEAVQNAKRHLEEIENKVKSLPQANVKVNAQTEEATGKVQGFLRTLRSIPRKVTTHIEAQTNQVREQMDRLAETFQNFAIIGRTMVGGGLTAFLPALIPTISSLTVTVGGLGTAFASAGAGAAAFGSVAVTALNDVFEANEKLSDLQEKLNKTTDAKKQQKILQEMRAVVDGLSSSQQKALSSLQKFLDFWDEFTAKFQAPVVEIFARSLEQIQSVIKALEPAFNGAVSAVDRLSASLSKGLKSEPVERFIGFLNQNAGPMLQTFGKIAGNVIMGLMNIFVAFGSVGSDLADRLLKASESFVQFTSNLENNQGFQNFINYAMANLPNVIAFIGELIKFIINFSIALAPIGQTVLQVANSFLAWLSSITQNHQWIAQLIGVLVVMSGLITALSPLVLGMMSIFRGLGSVWNWIVPIVKNLNLSIGTRLFLAFTSVGSAMSRVIPLILKVGSFLLRLANPVTLVISIIAALAIIIYQNWDSIKAYLAQVWNYLSSLAQTIFNMLGAFFSQVWNSVKSVSITVWNAIKSALSTAWNTIKTVASTVFEAIKTAISNIWNTIKSVTSTVWNAIKSALTATWNGIKSAVSAVFNAIQTVISTVWNAISTVTTTVWNVIKSVLFTLLNNLKRDFNNVFNFIQTIVSTVWNAIRSVTSSVWNGIKSAISSVINGIRSGISSAFNSIRSIISSVWNGVKSATSSAWNSVVSSVRGAVNKVIDFINRMINSINSVRIPIPKIPDWVPVIGGRGGGSIGFNIPNIPRLATGGVVDEPTLAIVGDAGAGNPEIVAPQRMLRSIIREELQNSGAQGAEQIQVVVPVVLDGREIMRVVTPYIDRELGQRRIGKMRANGIGGSVL
ncbi:TMP repeat-containing protein [Geobacillus sp. C56-T3]|uniref:phage tail protein n=1 Tax=Geobacillus sp. (strain C56-T3) TaxID=691437 RepID=UPI0001D58151|nr:TMP repeat-containing protein [Geobacillus sp. C56-T3]ADI25346.1 TMP repeat-containing protein [Geobacillus sp. C56-T3]